MPVLYSLCCQKNDSLAFLLQACKSKFIRVSGAPGNQPSYTPVYDAMLCALVDSHNQMYAYNSQTGVGMVLTFQVEYPYSWYAYVTGLCYIYNARSL